VWPLASRPDSGAAIAKPRFRSSSRFSTTAGFAHIASFMAGATTTGQRAARTVAVTRSSEWPPASLATRLAVAGATSAPWAQSPSATCGSATPELAKRSPWTGLPVSPMKVAAPMNRPAEAVIATFTSQPAWTSWETRSATL